MKKFVSLMIVLSLFTALIGLALPGDVASAQNAETQLLPKDVLSSAAKFGTYFNATVGAIPEDAFTTVAGEHIMTVKRPSGGADTGWYAYYTKDAVDLEIYTISYEMQIEGAAVGNNAPVYVNLSTDGTRPSAENYYKLGVKHAWAVAGYTTANEHTTPNEVSEIAKTPANQNLTFSDTEWIQIRIEVKEDLLKLYVNGKELTTTSRSDTGVLDGAFGLRFENVAWKIKNLQIEDKTPVTGTKINHLPGDVLSSATKFGTYFSASVGAIPEDAFATVAGEHIMTVKRPNGGADTGWYVYYTKDALDYDSYEISYEMMIENAAVGNTAPVYVNLNGDGSRPSGENYYKVGVKHAWAVAGYTTANEHTSPNEVSEIAKDGNNQNLTFSNTAWIKIKIVVEEETVKLFVDGREITTAARSQTGVLDGSFGLRYENVAWKIKNLSITGLNEAAPSASPSGSPVATASPVPSATPGNTQEENKPTGDNTSLVLGLLCVSAMVVGVIVVAKVRRTISE